MELYPKRSKCESFLIAFMTDEYQIFKAVLLWGPAKYTQLEKKDYKIAGLIFGTQINIQAIGPSIFDVYCCFTDKKYFYLR